MTLVSLIAGCAGTGTRAPQVDLAAERVALMDTDRAWSQCQGDPEASLAYFAEDAYFLPESAPIARGREQIRAMSNELFSGEGVTLTWEPTVAQVSRSGDLGYTIGTYRLTVPDAAGRPTTELGKYLTTWRKADGQWKVTADCYNSDGPPAGGH